MGEVITTDGPPDDRKEKLTKESKRMRLDDSRSRSNAGRGYLYLLQEREFLKSGENVFKVGRTDRDVWERFKEYPKGSRLLSCRHVPLTDVARLEAAVKERFRALFRARVDVGSESFVGPWEEMDDVIHQVVRGDRVAKADRSDVLRRTGVDRDEYDAQVRGFVRARLGELRGRRVAFEELERMFYKEGDQGGAAAPPLLKETLARVCREFGAAVHETLEVQFLAEGESSVLDAAIKFRAFRMRSPTRSS